MQGRVWIAMPGVAIELPGVGKVEIDPARPGLSRAARLAGEARASLREALLGAGVEDVQGARERRAGRAVAEDDAEVQRAKLAEVAPAGLEQLAREAAEVATARLQAEERLTLASRMGPTLERVRGRLAGQRIDAHALDMLRSLAHEVDLARAAWAAAGTELTIHALDEVRVRLGEDQPERQLVAGQEVTRHLVKPATLVIGNAELRLVPRGEDLVKTGARLERAERALGSALQERGAETLAQAEEMARARQETEGTKGTLEQRLAAVAPEGREALQVEVERLRARAQEVEGRIQAAREANARLGALEMELAANRVTGEAAGRIEALSEALAQREAEVVARAARLRWVSGAAAGQEVVIAEPYAIGAEAEAEVEAGAPGAASGVARDAEGWEVIPGELDEAGMLAQIERALEGALAHAGVPDLEAAKERWMAGLSLEQRQARLAAELERLAPGGVAALRARYEAVSSMSAGTREAAAQGEESTGDAPEPRAAVEAFQERSEAVRSEIARVEAERGPLEEAVGRCEEARRACERDVAELRSSESTLRGQLDAGRDRLASLRRVEPDEALLAQLAEAQAEARVAAEAVARAAGALAEAAPELHEGEVARAEGALRVREDSARALRESVVHHKALLDREALEGHFESLGEARAEQEAAAEALARLTREARAAKLLAEQVEDAYVEAQRQYVAPVVREALPYLNNLRPGTEIEMTQDLRLAKILRRGVPEDFAQLSGGTREQLSVIVRIALARVFARDRRPLPLLLDDTLGWTDDARFLSMVKILRDAAKELQILVLTCHGARFERLMPGYSADLDALKQAAGIPSVF
ncbi:Hypothetical protein CAP_8264 [Chondromyces apiculatus DSM 436]|uniref:DNA double-strand break repair Rad50 ATPase n=1 Tax=Chondromyces apiculatus DSM 436 TaxID=1192034 RepID=A0A017SYV7_9BACT|nr:Hypothetical protein CAP_8264 [Chondromyces apiculatus DSM 436]